MLPVFLNEQGFISVNAISRNCNYTDLISERMLFQIICCPHNLDHFSLIPNSLAKLRASRALRFMAKSKIYGAADGWQEFLFAVNGR